MDHSKLMPDYPRTLHLPHKPNATRGDSVAQNADIIFSASETYVEEKIDAANCGMMLYQGNPLIRNRNHFLNKAFTRRKTAAKMQFASIFNFFYENIDKFEKLNELLGYEASVYGEWMYALHGIPYDSLPNLFVCYDIYDPEYSRFLNSGWARKNLELAGFATTPLLHHGKAESYEQLEMFCNQPSNFSTLSKREGVYIKVCDEEKVIDRFKMVREGFVQGCQWSDKKITRNKLR